MPNITLPDGSKKSYPDSVSAHTIAESISAGLVRVAVAAEVDGTLVDMNYMIDHDASLRIITTQDPTGLDVIRHSTAHLLAQAVKSIFPHAQVTIGPVIENGFYYDFAFERPFTPEDLASIEKKMTELAVKNMEVVRKSLSREEAIHLFEQMGEHYKVQIIKDIPEGDTLTAYQQDNFIDLCRGPHVPRTGLLKAFKLTKLAGAYWRGDSRNEMLQRIYGTAWANKKDLNIYLKRLEEAKQRDHRELAKKMDLFHFQPEAPGNVFWHPKGWQIVRVIRDYVRDMIVEAGYEEVNTPLLADEHLWELSGHKAKFEDDMFTCESENRNYIVKPMSCPLHVQIFKQNVRSYRDLPIRYFEYGHVHRNEASGTLHGLLRLRAFVQDDGHIFCTEEQIHDEVLAFIDQIHQVYADFGFTEIIHKLSTRPDLRVGSDAVWSKAEHALEEALNVKQVDWELQPGEGAFYGPKIEFSLKDCLGRVWQCGTVQVDFSTADRLGACYVAEDGSKRPPVMIHRAMWGSTERFLGVLLEHYAGRLPLWLAPNQVIVMNITDRQAPYVLQTVEKLHKVGIRVKSDLRNEKIGFKIREHTIARVPYQVIIGDQEVERQSLAVRSLAEGAKSEIYSIIEFIEKLTKEIADKGR